MSVFRSNTLFKRLMIWSMTKWNSLYNISTAPIVTKKIDQIIGVRKNWFGEFLIKISLNEILIFRLAELNIRIRISLYIFYFRKFIFSLLKSSRNFLDNFLVCCFVIKFALANFICNTKNFRYPFLILHCYFCNWVIFLIVYNFL